MGYTTTFTGSVTVDPPLNAEEIAFLQEFAATRHEGRSCDTPGIWCKWVPSDDGSTIAWNGLEKFYQSSEWMQYLIDRFLAAPKGRKPKRRGPVGLTRNHVLNGSFTATGQDGAVWTIDVTDNAVVTTEVCGPRPATYALFVVERGTYRDLDREFDDAYGIRGITGATSIRADDPRFRDEVDRLLAEEQQLTACFDGLVIATNAEYGLSIELEADAIAVWLDVETALNIGEHAFAAAQGIAERLACELGWIAFDPAQRIAVTPGKNYRSRAIALARSWMREPDGRYLWSVV